MKNGISLESLVLWLSCKITYVNVTLTTRDFFIAHHDFSTSFFQDSVRVSCRVAGSSIEFLDMQLSLQKSWIVNQIVLVHPLSSLIRQWKLENVFVLIIKERNQFLLVGQRKSHGISVFWYVYLRLVDLHGKLVRKYTILTLHDSYGNEQILSVSVLFISIFKIRSGALKELNRWCATALTLQVQPIVAKTARWSGGSWPLILVGTNTRCGCLFWRRSRW